MTLFKNAIQNTVVPARTLNGALTNKSTTDVVVDLFFVIGAARNMKDADLFRMFEASLASDYIATIKMLFYARDVRGGAGERKTFTRLFSYFYKHYQNDAEKLIPFIAEYGRFKDVCDALPPEAAAKVLLNGIATHNALAAKWTPRKGPVFNAMRKELGVAPKALRKAVVELTKVVESQMCAKQWDQIIFDHVPSVAAARYQKAFSKHQPERYKAYRDALNSKDLVVRATAKINAGAIFPHDVLKAVLLGDRGVATAQWAALPDYLNGARILPMCDVSSSMNSSAGAGNTRCVDISISLGLYISEKQKGDFEGVVLTFSDVPQLTVLKGDIFQRAQQIQQNMTPYSTNIEGAFKEVLRLAMNNKLRNEDLPEYILVLSDMEFNNGSIHGKTNHQIVNGYYKAAGYTMPKLVYWNLNGRPGNNPVTVHDDNTCLVSGYSPAILKAILGGGDIEDDFSPRAIMMKTLDMQRYAALEEALR